MPVHTTDDNFANGHYKDLNERYATKGEEIVFQDSKDGKFYVLSLHDGVLSPVLLDPQPTYI